MYKVDGELFLRCSCLKENLKLNLSLVVQHSEKWSCNSDVSPHPIFISCCRERNDEADLFAQLTPL